MRAFQRDGARLSLSPDLVRPGGPRQAQLGALHAILAHATRSHAAAQVILPTGVGKTLVLTMVPYLLRCRRVLIVAPSKLVRDQIVAGFTHLELAKATGLLPKDLSAPRIATAQHYATQKDWRDWSKVDVVVGTPNVLSHGYPGVQRVPPDLFDVIIFDEAHHLPATTWTKLHEAVNARAVLLTATPFRSDGRRLPGEIAYQYPLRRAIDDGVYAPVTYIPVEAGDNDRDSALASAAATRLADPAHVAADSRLLVRTDRIDSARGLERLYRRLGVPLGVIVADTTWAKARTMRSHVQSGELKGFICVGALTEGFDFPALKIAAYHVPHKTLGPTVQFVGRLARVGDIGGELLSLRRDVSDETSQLYREAGAWHTLLPELVDAAVDREREVRRFVDEAVVSGPLDLPALALRPSRMAHVFRSLDEPDFTARPEKIAGAQVVQRLHHAETGLLAFVTRRIERPLFLRLDTLDSAVYELHLVAWVRDPGVLFIGTPTLPGLKDLRLSIGAQRARGLGAADLRRLLDAADLDRCFSVGLRTNRGHDALTSYRNNAGRKAEDGITESDARTHSLGHVMGRPTSGSGTFGFSVAKSKVWEPGAADSLYAFRQWCDGHAAELKSASRSRRPSALDRLAIPESLVAFPPDPVVVLLPWDLFASGCRLAFDGELVLPELVLGDASEIDGALLVSLTSDGGASSTYLQTVDGSVVHQSGPDVLVHDPDEPTLTPIADWISLIPWTVIFSGGESVIGDRISAPPPSSVRLADDVRIVRDWADTDITKEFGLAGDGRGNVANAGMAELAKEVPLVIQDHLAHELADFVGLRGGESAQVHLMHCKAAGGLPAARVGDVQGLVAQAMRSVRWLNPGAALWTELLRRLDDRPNTNVVVGTEEDARALLTRWQRSPPKIEWLVWLVQPGVSSVKLDEEPGPGILLAAAHTWCTEQQVAFRLLCSG